MVNHGGYCLVEPPHPIRRAKMLQSANIAASTEIHACLC